jgi:hypothetical protein
MDHDRIVAHLLERCTCCIEHIVQAPDLPSVAAACVAIFAQMRPVARAMRHAKSTRAAQQRQSSAVVPWCQDAGARDVHTRTVSPETLLGQVGIPVRTCQCDGCGASLRPDDRHVGVPERGVLTDAGRAL